MSTVGAKNKSGAAVRWFHDRWAWYLTLFAVFLVSWLVFAAERQQAWAWLVMRDNEQILRALSVLGLGVPVSQVFVGELRALAGTLSALQPIDGSPNRWPQRLLGTLETAAYALGFAKLDPKDVLTGVGAWIALKNFGEWSRFKNADDLKSGSGQPRKGREEDEPRRRLYVFLFSNVLQVAFGAGLGWFIRSWALK